MATFNKFHTDLLAKPYKRNVTKKFDPVKADKVKHFCKPVKHPIEPIHNRRLDMLAEQPSFKKTNKYVEPDLPSTCVSRAVLEAALTARLDHLSKPSPRYLRAMKEERRHLGKDYVELMNEKISVALSTIYYHNVKSLMLNQKEKDKKSKIPKPKPKNWDECGDKVRMEQMALPKPPPKQRQGRKRKYRKLALLQPRINELAVPNSITVRPSQDSQLNRPTVTPEALHYVATERILNLTKQPAWRLVKPWQPPGVTEAAKNYQISDRMTKLAEAIPRAHAIESDFKENAYEISPNALKYKPTNRILELSKPRTR